jgi:hypothetical protein
VAALPCQPFGDSLSALVRAGWCCAGSVPDGGHSRQVSIEKTHYAEGFNDLESLNQSMALETPSLWHLMRFLSLRL